MRGASKQMQRFSLACLPIVLTILFGCGQAKPPAVVVTPEQKAEPEPTKIVPVEVATTVPTVQPELVATAADGTAEATFQKTLIAFQEGRLDSAFDFLPESYQADVQGLVHSFAEQMDAELWAKCFDLLSKIANILKTKKALILNLDNVKNLPQIETIKPHWDAVAAGIHDVAASDISNLASLEKYDVRALLTAGSRLLEGIPLPKFGDVTVSTVNSDSESATLSYRDATGAEPKQVEFVKIEGKWLPKSIATGWSDGIANAKGRLSDLPVLISTFKPKVMQSLENIEEMLEQLQQAQTPDEFGRAMVPLAFAVKFGVMWAEQAMQEAGSAPRRGNPIRLVIDRELTDSEQTKLKDAVVAGVDDSNLVYEMIPGDGKTRCRFAPVPDGDAIVAVLQKHFAGASVRMDAATTTIHVELK